MTIQASRIRSCLVPLPVLAMCVALAGCNLDQGPGSAAATHLIPGRPPCTNSWCAQCGPCSGFHPTVWQSWQEGSMAVRGSPGETGIAPRSTCRRTEAGPHCRPPLNRVPRRFRRPKPKRAESRRRRVRFRLRSATRSPPRKRPTPHHKSPMRTRVRLRPAGTLLLSKRKGRLRPATPLFQPKRNCPPSRRLLRRFLLPRRRIQRSRSPLIQRSRSPLTQWGGSSLHLGTPIQVCALVKSRPRPATRLCRRHPKRSRQPFSPTAGCRNHLPRMQASGTTRTTRTCRAPRRPRRDNTGL